MNERVIMEFSCDRQSGYGIFIPKETEFFGNGIQGGSSGKIIVENEDMMHP